jgi:hypothetical protein
MPKLKAFQNLMLFHLMILILVEFHKRNLIKNKQRRVFMIKLFHLKF